MMKLAFGSGLTGFLIFVCVLILTIKGLILAFSASLLLGIVVLLIEPVPFILGLLGVCGHPEIAHKLAQAFGLS